MGPMTYQQQLQRDREIKRKVYRLGWIPMGGFRYLKDGKLYDLSSADLNQLDRIVEEGLFLVEA